MPLAYLLHDKLANTFNEIFIDFAIHQITKILETGTSEKSLKNKFDDKRWLLNFDRIKGGLFHIVFFKLQYFEYILSITNMFSITKNVKVPCAFLR